MCGATRCAEAYSSGAGAAEVYDGEVAAEQMRCKPERPELATVLRIRFTNQKCLLYRNWRLRSGIQKAGDLSAVRLRSPSRT